MTNSFVIGAAKCGTTTVADWLGRQDDVCVSKPKEPLFFTRAAEYIKGREHYLETCFPHYSGERLVFDCRPQTMMLGFAPARVQESCDEVLNFIVCVRNPVVRFYSDMMNYARMRPGREFTDLKRVLALNQATFDMNWADYEGDYEMQLDVKGGNYRRTYLEAGMYHAQMVKWKNMFPNANFHYAILEELERDPYEYYSKIANSIGIEYRLGQEIKHLNKGSGVTIEWLKSEYPSEVRTLESYYKMGIKNLTIETGIDFSEYWGI